MSYLTKFNLFLLAPILLGLAFGVFGQKKNDDFIADLNRNGKRDRVVKVKYKKPARLVSRAKNDECETRDGYFAKFVLYLDNRKRGATIFEYLIGDDEAVYWQYMIDRAIDLNKDGVKDLIFYAGDDTSEEYVFLIQKPSHFKAVYSGTLDLDYFSDLDKANSIVIKTNEGINETEATKFLAKWNPKSEVFEGNEIYWITENCVGLYDEPNKSGKILRRFYKGEILNQTAKTKSDTNGWQKIEVKTFEGLQQGWVETQYLSTSSPTKEFLIQ